MEGATLLRENAGAWHERLHRDKVTEETRRAFADWLGERSEHQTAYDAVDATWKRLQAAAQDSSILALRHETALRLTRRTSHGLRPIKWAAAAVVLAAFSAVVFREGSESAPLAWLSAAIRGHSPGHYVTATGERLNISLDDGSQVTLNTRTELEVTLTARERYIHLIHGQALFDVAHDHNRPFVVEADSRRFIAVGTAFDVKLDAGSVELTMLEGTVRVEHAPAPPPPQRSDAAKSAAARRGPAGTKDAARSDVGERTAGAELLAQSSGGAYIPRLVAAGEQLKAGEGSDDRVLPADAERVTSWRRGQIIFDNTRLGDAIAEVNRYSATQLRLDDPAVAELRLSGAFSTSRPRLFVEALTSYFPVQIERADEHVIVLGARH